MIAPDAAVHGDALLVRRAGLADVRVSTGCRCSRRASRRAPRSRLLKTLCLAFKSQPSSTTLRRPGGFVLAGVDGDEQQVRRGAEPDAAEADGDARQVRALVAEDLAGSKWPSPLVSSKMRMRSRALLAFGQPVADRSALDDPEPAAIVDGHGDRLDDVRLAGEQRGPEAFGQLDPLGGALRRQWRFISKSAGGEGQSEERGEDRARHRGGSPAGGR